MKRWMRAAFPGLMAVWLALLASHFTAGHAAAAVSASAEEWLPEAGALMEAVALAPRSGAAQPEGGHARKLAELVLRQRARWVDPARKFFPAIVPRDVSPRVVYPFGGGDLLGALVTYPGASEITTLSLEAAGDVRVLAGADGRSLSPLLDRFRDAFSWLLRNAHSKTTTLGSISGREVPGQMMFWFAALNMLDYEPVSLRYFRIGPDGQAVYFPRGAAAADRFDNAELAFRKRGVADAPVTLYRHIRANLDDAHLAARPELMAHLRGKGRIAAMTKAASFLLWSGEFSAIRDYLLASADWMVSDATGIPPRLVPPALFAQVTYGRFAGPCLPASQKDVDAFRSLWAAQPERALPFRYGYPDAKRQNHLVITARRAPAATPGR